MYRHKLDWLCDAGDDAVAALELGDSKSLRTGAGDVHTCRHAFASGLRLYDTRIRTRRTLVLQPQVPQEVPFVATNLALSGNVTARFDDGLMSTASRECGSVFRPRGYESAFRVEGEQSLHLIGVAADLPALARWFGPRLPEPLRPWLHDRLSSSRAAELPLPAARVAAASLLDLPYRGSLRAMMLEGVAMQVMAAVLEGLCGRVDECVVTGRERQAARDAHAMLLEDLRAPPGVGQLAQSVGLSARRLEQVFREVYGDSVFAILRRARLEHAMAALRAGDLPVKTVAWRVGYAYVANFTRAFQARFGVTPSAVRGRMRLPRD